MKEKIRDLVMLVKNDRRIMAIAGFFIFALILVSLSLNKGGNKKPKTFDEDFGKIAVPQEEAYNDLAKAFRNDLEKGSKEREELKVAVERLRTDQQQFQNQVASVIETITDTMDQLSAQVDKASKESKKEEVAPPTPANGAVPEGDDVEQIGFETTDVPPPPPPPAKPKKVSIISPGDSVQVELLTGVNAPVDGTPYPVVFKLSGPITGPDGSTLDVGEARLLAAAQGSETDGRAIFRLTKLAMRRPDGQRLVVDVDGWVVGEDGVRGMSGKLIDKLGRLIVATAGVSFGAALAEQVSEKNQSQRQIISTTPQGIAVDSSDFDVATSTALSDAANRLGQILLDRYEKLVPVVEILSGRTAAAIFSQASEVDVIDDDGEGIYRVALD